MQTECLNCGSIWSPGTDEYDFQQCDACGWKPGQPIENDDDFFDYEIDNSILKTNHTKMKKATVLFVIAALLTSCTAFKKLSHNQPVYTKNARYVGGNAKRFQQRHDAKLKRLAAKDSLTNKPVITQ